MAKIENTTVYPTVTPAADDLLIATDVSNENKTVTFLVSDIIGGTGVLQGLQSVLDTGNTATENINLTGNITVIGTVYPTTITASGSVGAAGQILSSTGTGLQWINSPSVTCCNLQDVMTQGASTNITMVTTAGITMQGAGQTLALSNNTDMTLAANCSITTEDDINLGTASILNFGTTSVINDYSGNTGTAGQVLTVNALGTGVQWSTLPTQSIPTLQQVLTAGNTATGIGISFLGTSTTTFGTNASIVSNGGNTWNGTNTFTANGTTTSTAGIVLSGSLYDGAGTGTVGQVLTSTATGVSWQAAGTGSQNLQQVLTIGNTATLDIITTGTMDATTITDGTSSVGTVGQVLTSTGTGLQWTTLATGGVTSVSQAAPSVSTGSPQTIAPTTGAVVVTPHTYAGGTNVGYVPTGGTASTFLRGDGTWATSGGAVSSVSAGSPSASTGSPITISPTTGAVVVTPHTYMGGSNVGYVPTGGTSSTVLAGNGTWTSNAPMHMVTKDFGSPRFNCTAGNYITRGNLSNGNFIWSVGTNNDIGATSPSGLGASMSEENHLVGLIYINPGVGGSGVTTSTQDFMAVSVSFVATLNTHTAGVAYTFELYKTDECTKGTYSRAWAGTTTVTSAGALNCVDLAAVSSAQAKLEPGKAYFLTVSIDQSSNTDSYTANISASTRYTI